jgi:ArsR family transcriptional regulator
MAPTAALDLRRTARLFHALSDETRLKILSRLRGGERCVCELMDAVNAAQSRLSFHLKALKEAGIVIDRREGRWNYYAIAPAAREELTLALALLEPRTGRNGPCC